jgi:lysophospholipid acyltransferase (LPLAT)-like uncharacterized protein
VVLSPLKTKRAQEFTSHLLDICLLFGVCCVLQANNGREFCSKAVEDLKTAWPEMKSAWHNQILLEPMSVERANQHIEKMVARTQESNTSN